MRLEEVLAETVKILQHVVIPSGISVEDAHAITKPVMDAIGNLTICLEAMKEAEKEGVE